MTIPMTLNIVILVCNVILLAINRVYIRETDKKQKDMDDMLDEIEQKLGITDTFSSEKMR